MEILWKAQFPQNFQTRTSGEITVFFPAIRHENWIYRILLKTIMIKKLKKLQQNGNERMTARHQETELQEGKT